MTTDPNEPAFPGINGEIGLTTREWFAGVIAAGYAAKLDQRDYPSDTDPKREERLNEFAATDANFALRLADALIAALNKEGE